MIRIVSIKGNIMRLFKTAGLLVLLGLMAATSSALAEIQVLNEYRHLYTFMTPLEAPQQSAWDEVYGPGLYDQSIQLQFQSATGFASQNSLIQQDGNQLVISGSFHDSMGMTEPMILAGAGSTSYLSLWLRVDGAFEMSGTVDVEGSSDNSGVLTILDSGPSGPAVYSEAFHPGNHVLDFESADMENQYVLELRGDIFHVLPEVGDSVLDMTFEITIVPAGAVATEAASWDRLKALYR